MNCKFSTIAQNHYRCEICHFEIRIQEDPNRIFRECQNKDIKANVSVNTTEFPSLIQQAKNFAGSMIDYAQDGFQNVSDEQYDERLKVCGSCPFYVNGSCSKCGCACAFKARMKAMKCPENKWPKLE